MRKMHTPAKFATLLGALLFLVASIGLAEVKMYTGVGTCVLGDLGTPEQAKNLAKEKAMQNAKEQAGVFLASYSRATNTHLSDNEISAITTNIISLVGEVKYEQTSGELNGQPAIVYTATLQAKVDTDGIKEWLMYDEKEKAAIVRQNEEIQNDLRNSINELEQLTQQYDKAESRQEKEEIRREFNDVGKKLLASQKIDEGNVLYYKGDYNRAIQLWNEALAINPKLVEAYNNRGNAYSNKGEYDRAIADYSQALAINPNLVEVYNNRGNAYEEKGDYDRAITDYNQALAIQPEYANAYNNRGNAYQYKGDYDRAIADYNQALAIHPEYADAYYNRGRAYAEKGDYDRAIADFTQALAIHPKYAHAYYYRGYFYYRKGEYDRAIADWRKYLEFHPDDEDIKNNIQILERKKHEKRMC